MNNVISEEKQYKKMTETKTKKLVMMLSIPTIISMLVTAIYNIADTFFVSQLGKSASGAVGVVFSLMAIIQAVGFTYGMGSGSLISSKLGEKKGKEAQIIGSTAFFGAIFVGILITIFSLIFMTPIMELLGATKTVLPYAKSYAIYIVLGSPIMTGSFVLNNILRSEGKSKLAMVGLTTGGILNVILDPIFIFTCNLGISGAAVATLISQLVSFFLLLSMFLMNKSIIKLSIKNYSFDYHVTLDIIKVGFPSFCRQGFACLAAILLNNQAGIYGDDAALSGLSIVSKIFMVIFSVCLGVGQGYQPVCGYNYFAKKYDRVKEALSFTFLFTTIAMTTISILFYIFSNELISFFIDDYEVIEIGSKALRYQCMAMPFLSLNVMCNMTYQSTRKKVRATLLSCCRQGIFFLPLVFTLPNSLGLQGVEMVQPLADISTWVFSVPFFILIYIDLKKKIKTNNSLIVQEN